VNRYPGDTESARHLGRLLAGEGRYTEAAAVFAEALALDPDNPNLANSLGLAYLKSGRTADAIAMHQRYVALAPSEPNAHDSLAMSYLYAGRYDESLAEYERALTLNPEFEVARVHRGNVYYELGRFRDAAAEYVRYSQSPAPTFGRGEAGLAWVYIAQGKRAAALAEARIVAKKSRWFSSDLLLLALAAGDVAQARAWANRPSQPFTDRGARLSRRSEHVALGQLAIAEGRIDEGRTRLEQANAEPPVPWSQDTFDNAFADANLRLGRLDDAAAQYERVLKNNPRQPAALYHYAQVLEGQHKDADARAMLERFLAVWAHADADAPARVDAERRLAALTRGGVPPA
jgi:tetratricopeptide (TPR) repeat protein